MGVQPSTNSPSPWIRNSVDTVIKNRQELVKIASILELVLPTATHQVRVEGSTYGLFTNDKNLINQIHHRLTEFVTEIHRPEDPSQAVFLLTNKNKVICEELPHENYRFKIYFKNGDANLVNTTRFVDWADRYNDGRIYIPKGTRNILTGNTNYSSPYIYGQYFYVKDQKMASMTLLAMGDMLNKTEEFVLKSEVNA